MDIFDAAAALARVEEGLGRGAFAATDAAAIDVGIFEIVLEVDMGRVGGVGCHSGERGARGAWRVVGRG